MKILHLTNYYIYHGKIGGAERAVERMIREDKENKHFIITLPFNGYYKNVFKVKPLSILRNLYLTLLPFDFLVFLQTLNIFKKIKPDVIYAHNLKDLTFAPLVAAKLLKIKIKVFIYDYWFFCPYSLLFNKRKWEVCRESDCYSCFGFIGKFFRIRRHIFNFFMKIIDEFIVLSKASKRVLLTYGIPADKIIIKKLRYKSLGKIENREEPNLLLYIGWIVPQKGLHILIRALSEIKDVDFKLCIIGDNEVDPFYTSYIKGLIKEFGLESRIEVLGKRSFNKVKEFYSKAKIVIIPEQWENVSPLVAVEAKHYRKKIIASNIGGIPEIVGENATLVAPKDYKGFAKAIKNELSKASSKNSFNFC